jgi:tripeptide aminopeptidase
MSSGFTCTNLANGTERNHEPTERVSVDALEGMLEVAIALFEEAPAALEDRGSSPDGGSS